MKKRIPALLLALALCTLALTGCGRQPDTAQPPLETVSYSNLTDDDSRALLTAALRDGGISQTRIDSLLKRVDLFNDSVRREWLTDGFETAAPTETKYDPYTMQDTWAAKNGSFPGYNCRITALSLLGDSVTADSRQPDIQGDEFLFLDLETLKQDPAVLCGEGTDLFCALFAPVQAADSTLISDQAAALQAGWAARGIDFTNGKASLISVIFHDRFDEGAGTLSVGHVGVLLPAADGSLLFVEKVAFQEPYRLVKAANRTALSDYLTEKYDTAWGQDTARPFVMENDTLMEGFRPNPLAETNA